MIDEQAIGKLLFRHDKACNEGATYNELAIWAKEAANVLEALLPVLTAFRVSQQGMKSSVPLNQEKL